jgi:hypothetical protein
MKYNPELKPWCVVVGEPNMNNWKSHNLTPNRDNIGLFAFRCDFDSKEDAIKSATRLSDGNSWWSYAIFHNVPEPEALTAYAMINNHVCPSCNNDRVNKNEKSCWRCGSTL